MAFSKRSRQRIAAAVRFYESQPRTTAKARLTGHSGQRQLALAYLKDHLPAPTAFGDEDHTTAEADLYRIRLDDDHVPERYELDDAQEAEPIDVVNWFPWTWEYKHSVILVTRLHGVWIPEPRLSIVLGKTAEEIDKDASGTVNVHWGDPETPVAKGDETSTGLTIEVFNRYADATDDAWVTLQWHNEGWELRTLECFE